MDPTALFGERVKALRLAKGLTQEQLGERLGLAATTVANYERGERLRQDLVTLLGLADALGTTVDYLVRGIAVPAGASPFGPAWERAFLLAVTEGYSPEEAEEALRVYRRLRQVAQILWELLPPPPGRSAPPTSTPGPTRSDPPQS